MDIGRRMFLLPVLQNLRKPGLFIISNENVHGSILQKFLACGLYVAAGRNDYRIRIHFLCPVEHLTGFPVRHIGDTAGIYNIGICFFIKRNDLISPLFQDFLHCLCLI